MKKSLGNFVHAENDGAAIVLTLEPSNGAYIRLEPKVYKALVKFNDESKVYLTPSISMQESHPNVLLNIGGEIYTITPRLLTKLFDFQAGMIAKD